MWYSTESDQKPIVILLRARAHLLEALAARLTTPEPVTGDEWNSYREADMTLWYLAWLCWLEKIEGEEVLSSAPFIVTGKPADL